MAETPAALPKVAVITGCASGIGLATSQLFLERGHQVLGIDVKNMDMSSIPTDHQGRFQFYKADLTDGEECVKSVAKCVEHFGKVDVLANVAGIMDAFSSADAVSNEELSRLIAVNLTAPIMMMRAALKYMKEQKKGSIVNVGSRASEGGGAAGIAYTASKHGILGATKNVAWRFRNEGIRCNIVSPGGVASQMGTSMVQENFDLGGFNELKYVWELHTPNSQVNPPNIQPREVAHAIYFLASDEANRISGANLPVDRAWSSA